MDQIIKTNTATTSTFLNTSEVLEEQWKTAKQTIRDKIASTAQSQARRMLEEEIGPEQLCEELSKLRLDYVSINVTENEARDKMSQNYIEAMMKNMGQVTGRITARELNLKNDVLQMLNDELQKQNDELQMENDSTALLKEESERIVLENDALKNQILEQENASKKDIIKLELYGLFIHEKISWEDVVSAVLPAIAIDIGVQTQWLRSCQFRDQNHANLFLQTINSQYVKKCHDQQLT
jgi:hypothetical protein